MGRCEDRYPVSLKREEQEDFKIKSESGEICAILIAKNPGRRTSCNCWMILAKEYYRGKCLRF
jgi:hypothetical protein